MGETDHATVSVPESLKDRMDEERAPGQSYAGFIQQMMIETGRTDDEGDTR